MPFYTANTLANNEAGFEGTWNYSDDILTYITPANKVGSLQVELGSRYSDGTAIIDIDGTTVPSYSATISVAAGSTVTVTPTITGSSATGVEVMYDPTETLTTAPNPGGLLVPGSAALGSWTTTAQPGTEGNSSGKLVTNDYLPMTSFIEPPATATTSSTHKVSVIADHANGIDRVEFYANGGAATVVTTEVPRTDWGVTLDSRIPQGEIFTAELDLSNVAAGVPVEVRAIVYPIYGTPRVLQGSPISTQLAMDSNEVSQEVQEGTLSIFVTKVASQKVIDVTAIRGLSAAIANEVMSWDATKQYVFKLGGALNNWNDGLTTSVNMAPYIPIVVRGDLANRGTYIYDANCPLSSSTTEPSALPNSVQLNNTSTSVDGAGCYVQYENLHLDQSTTQFDSPSKTSPMGHIIKDCFLDRGLEVIGSYRGTTLTNLPAMAPENSDGLILLQDPFTSSTVYAPKYCLDQPNFDIPDVVFNKPNTSYTSPSRAGCGVFILESKLVGLKNLGQGVMMQRNNLHLANTQDVCGSGTALNIFADDTNFRGKICFIVADTTIEFWDPDKVYVPGAKLLVQDSSSEATVPAPRWGVYTLNPGENPGTYLPPGNNALFDSEYPEDQGTMGDIYWNRSDPHVDMYQPPVNTTAGAVQNVIYQNAYIGENALMQPILHAWKVNTGMDMNGMGFKNWTCFGEQVFASPQRCQFTAKMTHHVMRNWDWTPTGSRQFVGMTNYRWRNEVDDTPVDFCIIDSTLGRFAATGPAYQTDDGTSLADWAALIPGDVKVSNSTGTYGFVSPSGVLTLEGNANVGSTLTFAGTIVNEESNTITWYRSDDGSTNWSVIAGETSASYTLVAGDLNKHIKVESVAVGLPPDLLQEGQVGPVNTTLTDLGSFEFTWTGATTSDYRYNPATDDVGRTGVWAGPPKGGTAGTPTSAVRFGSGNSSADDGTAGKGLYGTDTHAFTGEDQTLENAWAQAGVNGSGAFLTLKRIDGTSGAVLDVSQQFLVADRSASASGYFNIGATQIDWASGSDDFDAFVVGDIMRIEGSV